MRTLRVILIVVVCLVALTSTTTGCTVLQTSTQPTSTYVQPIPKEEGVCTRVVDGDTIKVTVNNKEYTVRYIGMDTPETVAPGKPVEFMGPEATAKNKELVEGKKVRLEKDVSETDQYGRLLRYVYANALCVNVEMVRLGYAQVATYPPDVKYVDALLEAQRYAKLNSLGLWKASK